MVSSSNRKISANNLIINCIQRQAQYATMSLSLRMAKVFLYDTCAEKLFKGVI